MDAWDILKLQNITYQQSMIACAYMEMEAMKVENSVRSFWKESPAYSEKDFMALIEKHQLHHNAVLTNLHSGL